MFKFVVCGENIALGIFSKWDDAVCSIRMSDKDAEIYEGGKGKPFTLLISNASGRQYTITQVRECGEKCRLF